jgi:small subunit ribosomal protein S4
LIGLLEQRLETIVYRAKFVPTVFAARQFINHGHVKVNGKRVTFGSYQLKEGDVVEVKEKSRELPIVLSAVALNERDVPQYIEADHKKMSAKFIRVPQLADVPYPVAMEPHLVVEYYSR